MDLFSEVLTDCCYKDRVSKDLELTAWTHKLLFQDVNPFELGCHVRREREQTNLIYSLFGNAHNQTNERVSKNLDLQAVVPRISQFELGCHVRREREQTNLIYSLFGNAHNQTNERVSKNLDLQAVVPRISQFELGCHVKRESTKETENLVLIYFWKCSQTDKQKGV